MFVNQEGCNHADIRREHHPDTNIKYYFLTNRKVSKLLKLSLEVCSSNLGSYNGSTE
jgi:hypothetical protein